MSKIQSVKIGNQVWSQQNLRYTSFENGDELFHAKTEEQWLKAYNDKIPAYCGYDNDELFSKGYGMLYNWFAIIDKRQLPPTGWHIPHVLEVVTLLNELDNSDSMNYTNFLGDNKFFGQKNSAGGKLKATDHWDDPNTGATNQSEFGAYPSGYRDYNGNFQGVCKHFFMWTKSKDDRNKAYFLGLNYYDESAVIMPNELSYGYSIRCIKDE